MRVRCAVFVALSLASGACRRGPDPTPPDADPVDSGPTTGSHTGDTGESVVLGDRGVLQFHVVHNLADDGCLALGTCDLDLEETADPPGWVAELQRHADLPVLHWDRGVPWAVFAEPPVGDPVAFYDARVDPEIVAWVDAFAPWFAERPGYVAVSVLAGTRDRLADELVGASELVAQPAACVGVNPDAELAGARVGDSYARFVDWLRRKLRPHDLAIGVELDLFRAACPAQWDGLVDLYREVFDATRAADPSVALYGTVTLTGLLAYDQASCYTLALGECGEEPPPTPVPATSEVCYPLDRTPIDDLAAGGRLDVLALSFYPDGLLSDPLGAGTSLEFRPEDSDGTGPCIAQAPLPALPDPWAALDRLGWTGPMAIAETGGRSCPIPAWVPDGTGAGLLATIPASPASQAHWLRRATEQAQSQGYRFVNNAFLRDFPPLGPWTYQQGVLDPTTFSIFQAFACMGLTTEDGSAKPELAGLWP